MKILAISGSIRKDSYNTALLSAIAERAPEDMQVTLFGGVSDIPIFDPALNDEALPGSVKSLLSMIRESDGVIFSTPEYAHGITGVLKNMLDWLVASDALILKPVMVASVSTSGLGGIRALSPLITILTAMNTHVVIESLLCVPHAKSKFNDSLKLINDITVKRIEVSMLAFEKEIMKGKT